MQYDFVANEYEDRFPLVVSLPHSGTYVPESVRKQMRPHVVLPNTDWFLPELYSFFKPMGVTVLENRVSRYVIDPNRAPDGGTSGDYTRSLVYERTTQGRLLYMSPPGEKEVQKRKREFYDPYHRKLQELLQRKREIFGWVCLLDLHSFFLFPEDTGEDCILSNDAFRSSSSDIFGLFRSALVKNGFSVAENHPVRGGHITRKYGETGPWAEKTEALQMELRYTCYIEKRWFGEEEVTEKDPALFADARNRLNHTFSEILRSLSTFNVEK